MAYDHNKQFKEHIFYFISLGKKPTFYTVKAFKYNISMAIALFAWSGYTAYCAFRNAGFSHRWSPTKMKLASLLGDYLTAAFLGACIATFFGNFKAVGELQSELWLGMLRTMEEYEETGNKSVISRIRIDELQYNLECCGMSHWSDWMLPPMRLSNITAQLVDQGQLFFESVTCDGYTMCYVPWSCCSHNTTEDTCVYGKSVGSRISHYLEVNPGFHPNGCYVMLIEHFSTFLRRSSTFWGGVSFCVLIVFISWRMFFTSLLSSYKLMLDTIRDRRHPRIAPGWFFPCYGYPSAVYIGEDNDDVDIDTWGVGMRDDDDDEEGAGQAEGEGGDKDGGGGDGGKDKKGKKKKGKNKRKGKKGMKKRRGKRKGGLKRKAGRRGKMGGRRRGFGGRMGGRRGFRMRR
uniref:Tetraspanin n=1 Tax=Trichuris muris TaxID=70415 RepID=A0A5S6R3A8_TRIMR